MGVNPHIKEHPKERSQEFTRFYKPAQQYIDFNLEDPILDTVRVYLPKPPPLETIEGYGLRTRDQKWVTPKIPIRLQQLEKKYQSLFLIKKFLLDHQVDYEEESAPMGQGGGYGMEGG